MSSTKQQQPYFPHYANNRNEDNIIRLRMEHGVAGYGVYHMLLERLRMSESYRCELDYNILCFDLDCDAELIRSVIYNFGLFEIVCDGQMFQSVELNTYMQVMEEKKRERTERARKAAEARWGISSTTIQQEPQGEEIDIEKDIAEPNSKKEDTQRLDNEIEAIKRDDTWLNQMSEECGQTKQEIMSWLPDFKKTCVLRGIKNGHKDMVDAFTHFRSWIYKTGRAKDPEALKTKNKYGRTGKSYSVEKLNLEQEERNARWNEMADKKMSPELFIKNKGYDPENVTIVQIMRPGWCENNPPTHPEWIGKYGMKTKIETQPIEV